MSLCANSTEHPAVSAWRSIQSHVTCDMSVTTLRSERTKSAVYRIGNARPAGHVVIAKHCRTSSARVEHAVYTLVLPQVPYPTLQCFGIAQSVTDDHFSWLFLEEATGSKYALSDPVHRILAAQWLGTLHASIASPPMNFDLPARNAEHYRGLLRLARAVIQRNLANPAYTTQQLELLHTMVDQFTVLDTHWSEVSRIMDEMPQTLVHGGFYSKNVQVGNRDEQQSILAYDWESAGWGAPVVDLAYIDIPPYSSIVRDSWPNATLDSLKQAAYIGKMLWLVKAIPEEEPVLASPWVSRVMGKFKYYSDEMQLAFKRAGFGNR